MKHSLVVIAVGGSGGHLYPARALAEELMQKSPHITVAFLGHGLSTSKLFNREGFRYLDVQSATFSFKKICALPRACLHIFMGVVASLKFFYNHTPDLVIGFGSYHSLPVLIAAYLKKVRYMLFEANAVLGKVNKLFSKGAYLTTYQLFDLQEAKSSSSFAKASLPTQKDKLRHIPQAEARRYFDLNAELKTLLIFGGSQGATSLSTIALGALFHLKQKGVQFQVIHLIGLHMDEKVIQQLYEEMGIRASVKVHEPQMCYAYSAADLLISRSGANTIAEQIYHKLPAVFIPYPYLSDDHQTLNARYVCDQLKGGVMLAQQELTEETLANHITTFLQQEFYDSKKAALQAFTEKQEGRELSEMVLEILKDQS